VEGADAYIRIGFASVPSREGTLFKGETLLVQFRVEPPESYYYQLPRDQTNDYSYGACPSHASSWPRIVLLEDGVPVSGELPSGVRLGEDGAGGQGSAGQGGAGPTEDQGGAGGSAGAW